MKLKERYLYVDTDIGHHASYDVTTWLYRYSPAFHFTIPRERLPRVASI